MLKLVNQFDEPNTRVSSATPTCCCCCCCIATTITSGVVTAFSLKSKIKPNVTQASYVLRTIGGFFAIPIALALAGVFTFYNDYGRDYTMIVNFIFAYLMVYFAYQYLLFYSKKAAKPLVLISVMTVSSALVLALELYIWLVLVFSF